METNQTLRARRSSRALVALILASTLALGGCATFDVPDAINPNKWDFFSDDEAASTTADNPVTIVDTTMDPASDVRPPDSATPELQMSDAPPPPAMPMLSVEPVVAAPQPVQDAPSMPNLQLRPPANAETFSGEPFSTVVITSNGVATTEPMASSIMTPMEAATGLTVPQSEKPVQFPTPGETTGYRAEASVGGMLHVASLYFANNSDKLTRRDHDILSAVVQLKKERGGTLFVIGHASSRTRDMDYVRHVMTNFEISTRRANVVAAALRQAGVMEDQLQIHAVSDTVPLYYEVMPSGEAGNRRVEIYLAP